MERKLNKKKIFGLIFILFIIIITIVFSILYRKNLHIRSFFDVYIFRKHITENTLPKIEIENAYCYSFNDTLVVLEKNILTFYNKSANSIGSLELEISEPIFKTTGKYLCIAEKNGGKLYLISNKNIIWQKNLEGNINNISVNKNGYVAVSIVDTTYKNICKVYNSTGTELFTTYLSKSYIIDSAISNDNNYLVLAEANFSGITIQSNVKIISIEKTLNNSKDTIIYNYTAPIGDFIITIGYNSNGGIVCLYDNHIALIQNNSCSELYNFTKSNTLFADINNKLVLVEKKSTGLFSQEFELQIIDTSTSEKKTYTLQKEPKSIEVSNNVIAINFGTEALFINNSGWLIKDYTSTQEIQSIVLSNNLAGIVYKNKIEFVSL